MSAEVEGVEGIVQCVYAQILRRVPNGDEIRHWTWVIKSHGAPLFFELVQGSAEAKSIRQRDLEARKHTANRFARLRENMARADHYLDALMGQIATRPIRIKCVGFEEDALPADVHRRLIASDWISVSMANDVSGIDDSNIAIYGPSTISALLQSESVTELNAELNLFVLDGFAEPSEDSSALNFRILEDDFMMGFVDNLDKHVGMGFLRHPAVSRLSVTKGGPRHPAVLVQKRRAAHFGSKLSEQFSQNALAKLVLFHFIVGEPSLACVALDELDKCAGTHFVQQYSAIVGLIEI